MDLKGFIAGCVHQCPCELLHLMVQVSVCMSCTSIVCYGSFSFTKHHFPPKLKHCSSWQLLPESFATTEPTVSTLKIYVFLKL